MLDRCSIDLAYPSSPVNILVTAMVQLFRPTIETLLLEQDRAISEWQSKHPNTNVYEDRKLEITSFQAISVGNQIKAVGKALKKAKA
jgi:hypothetical protein